MSRILVVDDEVQILRALRRALAARGHEVLTAPDGEDAIAEAEVSMPDLVVLDLNLPGIDGMEVCRRLRTWTQVPILILSVREDEAGKVQALDLGADDYLTKPFGVEELLARVRALLRRGSEPRAPVLRVADLTLDPATRKVVRGERQIELTIREWALLEYFMRSAGRILTRPMLVQHVWGLDFDPESNIVDVYVGYLRRKVDGPHERKLFHTVRGAGYVLRDRA